MIEDRLPAILKNAGVTRLVSKWDEQTLKDLKSLPTVDVTDHLLREFTLNEKQRKTAAELRTAIPLPLHKAEQLMKEGKL